MIRSRHSLSTVSRRMRQLALAIACLPLLQSGGCLLLDGHLAERVLTGALLDPIAQQVFQTFFAIGAGV